MKAALTICLFIFAVLPANAEENSTQAQPTNPYKAVSLYFENVDGQLATEQASIPRDPILEKEIKSAIEFLASGPQKLAPTIPKSAVPETVFLDGQKIVYLDFSQEISTNHPGGITNEIISVASVCKTVLANFEVEGLRILIKGQEAKTLAGHVDLDGIITRQKCDNLARYKYK
jgi:spore germination protein GerM